MHPMEKLCVQVNEKRPNISFIIYLKPNELVSISTLTPSHMFSQFFSYLIICHQIGDKILFRRLSLILTGLFSQTSYISYKNTGQILSIISSCGSSSMGWKFTKGLRDKVPM